MLSRQLTPFISEMLSNVCTHSGGKLSCSLLIIYFIFYSPSLLMMIPAMHFDITCRQVVPVLVFKRSKSSHKIVQLYILIPGISNCLIFFFLYSYRYSKQTNSTVSPATRYTSLECGTRVQAARANSCTLRDKDHITFS